MITRAARQLAPAIPPPPWLPDRGDGTYRNPILHADYSDPDAIRVGEDYWLTSSSFSHVPGLPILHSRDLVNWTLVNHALPRLEPEANFVLPRHGAGVWAPSLRFHAGKFWLFYPDPDFGLYVVTAEDPRARWSPPHLVKPGKGLIDPCPFWDADGNAYLVHAWAKSRSGIKNRLTLHRLADDFRSVVDAGRVIVDGDHLPGWHTLEGPKLHRHGKYYYIFAPAGGVSAGYQAVFRSPHLYGPYEHRVVLAQGATAVNGPHQGAWVDTAAGEHWFLHFQEMPAYGRVVHLQPMTWRDGWPAIGSAAETGIEPGEPVLAGRLPLAVSSRRKAPATSDEFEGPALGLQWQWQANPRAGWSSLVARAGWLRLRCVAQGSAGATLWSAAHLLLQKFPAFEFEATTLLDFAAAAEGDAAGLVVFGCSYAWLGLCRERTGFRVMLGRCDAAHEGGAEQAAASAPFATAQIFLRVRVSAGARCEFSFSADGLDFTAIGPAFLARSSHWVGAKVGLFASARAAASAGCADFDWFRVGPVGG